MSVLSLIVIVLASSTVAESGLRERLPDEIIPIKLDIIGKYAYSERNPPELAVDLDFGTDAYIRGSAGVAGTWLQLSLDGVYCVRKVVTYDRWGSDDQTFTCSGTDCPCSPVDIGVCRGYSLAVSFSGKAPDNLPRPSGCIYGNIVKIHLKDNYTPSMIVTEIAITGKREHDEGWLQFGTATQSTTDHDGDATKAIDGNTNGQYWGGSCTHTIQRPRFRAWWSGTLKENSVVDKVVIYNREDCCSDRIKGAEVFVERALCGQVNYEEGKSVYEIACGALSGRRIFIKMTNSNLPLTLCEVQAFGSRGGQFTNCVNTKNCVAGLENLPFSGTPTGKMKFEFEYRRNPGGGHYQMISFFNDEGALEDFVTFYDESQQKIRKGHNHQGCYYTRNVANTVTGETARITIEVSDEYLWLTINGKDPIVGSGANPYPRNMSLSRRRDCHHETRNYARMMFTSNMPIEGSIRYSY